MGKRLGSLTRNSTKCMVPFNGRRLIEYTLDALSETKNISRVVFVVGHGADEVKGFLGDNYHGMPILYIYNPVYDKTNNIYSLQLASDHLKYDDTILLESDLIFEPGILSAITTEVSPDVVAVARYESWMDGTVVTLDEDNHVSSFISKKDFNWTDVQRYFKTVNIYKLSKEFCRNKFVPFLDAYVSANGLNGYYEEVLKILAFIDSSRLKALPIGNNLWYEIDDVQDLDIASTLFARGNDRLRLIQKRFGGYWRFPLLKDFCYLVNPYFPTSRMIDEMKSNYANLLMHYPSGQNIQNLLGSKMFGCEESHMLVGNGAAELIKSLMPSLQGAIGISFPTFNEYHETIRDGQLVEYHTQHDDFSYSAQELLSFCAKNNIASLVIINPDNPSGHFIAKNDLLSLARDLETRGTTLIVDESFVDFVDGTHDHTLIDSNLLRAHRNLVVIKSISKSYGVPGLRLGIMATANSDLLLQCRKNLSIWNINSFGEHFLQIIGKYTDEYVASCVLMAKERERLFNRSKDMKQLRPIRSHANYILFELKGNISSAELTDRLLSDHMIFIKDCHGKIGIGSRDVVRIAVRDEHDNDCLLTALHSIFNNNKTTTRSKLIS